MRLAEMQVWPALRYLACDGAIDGGVDIGVVEDDEGRAAAEFEADFLDLVGTLPHQDAADLGRAGEADLAHLGIGAEFAADRVAFRGEDEVEDALRESRRGSASACMASATSGVCSAGFRITVQPTASAGEILRATIEAGKFHGVIVPTTPTGCLITSMRRSVEGAGMVSP